MLNGGDGWHAHPTQALLDLYTMRDAPARAARSTGRKVVILGDVLHSRVARSNIWTLTAAGADLWLCGPSTLLRGFEAWAGAGRRGRAAVPRDVVRRRGAARRRRRDGAADPAERMASGLLPSLREYAARYGLTARAAARWPGRARSSCTRAR